MNITDKRLAATLRHIANDRRMNAVIGAGVSKSDYLREAAKRLDPPRVNKRDTATQGK